jgi:hypothetical protein
MNRIFKIKKDSKSILFFTYFDKFYDPFFNEKIPCYTRSFVTKPGYSPRFVTRRSKTRRKLCGQLLVNLTLSGQSPDIVYVTTAAAHQGRPTIAVTTDIVSPLAAAARHAIPLHAHKERSDAATNADIELFNPREALQAERLVILDNPGMFGRAHLPLSIPAGIPEWRRPLVAIILGQLLPCACGCPKSESRPAPGSQKSHGDNVIILTWLKFLPPCAEISIWKRLPVQPGRPGCQSQHPPNWHSGLVQNIGEIHRSWRTIPARTSKPRDSSGLLA